MQKINRKPPKQSSGPISKLVVSVFLDGSFQVLLDGNVSKSSETSMQPICRTFRPSLFQIIALERFQTDELDESRGLSKGGCI